MTDERTPTRPSARVLLDSISPRGHRVTTMEVVMHRFVLAEFNTHRAFSRNSASSRARPARRVIQEVSDDPALPLSWPREQRGMRGGDEVSVEDMSYGAEIWRDAAENAVKSASELTRLGVHKSVVNRLLEPFLWHTVIVTGDEEAYVNFFVQRCSPLAQPELRAAANAMLHAHTESDPCELDYDEWHTPLIQPEDVDLINAEVLYRNSIYWQANPNWSWWELTNRVSAARCARVSYLTHEGKRDVTKDLELYDRLVSADPPHWSPLEHVCRPWSEDPVYDGIVAGGFPRGNLRGWVQLRHVVETARNRDAAARSVR